MPFSDPMADGPAIQAAGQRALKRGMTLRKTLAMVRELRARDDGHPDRADGLLQPDLPLWRRRVRARRGRGRGRRGRSSSICRPRRTTSWPRRRAAPGSTSSASRRRPATRRRLPAVVERASGFHLLRRDRRDHRHPLGRCRRCAPPRSRGCAASPDCRSRSASASRTPAAGRRGGAAPPTPRWSARRSSIAWRSISTPRAAPSPASSMPSSPTSAHSPGSARCASNTANHQVDMAKLVGWSDRHQYALGDASPAPPDFRAK